MSNTTIASSEDELTKCYPVIVQLRPHLEEQDFIQMVNEQQKYNYKVAYVEENNQVVAVAGFRTSQCLAWGKFLYVDDLVTDDDHRSKGYGKKLLTWLKQYAKLQGCQQLHLDSGMQRQDAHRFYDREKMTRAGYHFSISL